MKMVFPLLKGSSSFWLLYTEELFENKWMILEVIGIENDIYLNYSSFLNLGFLFPLACENSS